VLGEMLGDAVRPALCVCSGTATWACPIVAVIAKIKTAIVIPILLLMCVSFFLCCPVRPAKSAHKWQENQRDKQIISSGVMLSPGARFVVVVA
jgi:hypothetical protein